MPQRLITAFLLIMAALPANAKVVQREGTFRVQLPAKWEEVKVDSDLSKNTVASFVGPFMVSINRVQDSSPPEVYLNQRVRSHMVLALEENASLAGLPARRFVTYQVEHSRLMKLWVYVVLSQGEYWEIVLHGFPEEWDISRERWDDEQRDRWKGAEQFVSTFEFLDPTLTRLKAQVSPRHGTDSSEERWYVLYNRLRLRLPEGWTYDLSNPSGDSSSAAPPDEALLSIIGADKSEATVALRYTREKDILEGKLRGGNKKLSEQRLTVSGLPAITIDVITKDKQSPRRMRWLIIRAGDGGYCVVTHASVEAFSRYQDVLAKILDSTEVLNKAATNAP